MTATILTVAQQKGGAGKTTMAIQLGTALAAAGHNVAMVDIDPQGSLTNWMRLREHRATGVPEIQFAMIGGWRLEVELDRLKRDHDFVVVDSPPHAETDAKVAIRAAGLVLVPCQPSTLDIWASKATLDIAQKEKRRLALVMNRVPPRGHSVDEARAAIAELGCKALSAQLGNRQAFIASVKRGLGVVESEPRGAAAEESRTLALEVVALLS